MTPGKVDIGDGVFVEKIGNMFRLTTENGNGFGVTHTIYLDADVLDNLRAYADTVLRHDDH